MSSQGQSLLTAGRELPEFQRQIKQGLKRVTVQKLNRRRIKTLPTPQRILEVTFRELNLIAISPVAMFDVARIVAEAFRVLLVLAMASVAACDSVLCRLI